MNGCLRDRSWRIQVPSSELFIWHLCAMCWSLLQRPSLLQSSFRSPPLFKYKHLQERCWSYLENENCQFMCWSCANSQGGGMMEGRASLKRCSQSGARHKPLQRVYCSTICLLFTRFFICCFLPKAHASRMMELFQQTLQFLLQWRHCFFPFEILSMTAIWIIQS